MKLYQVPEGSIVRKQGTGLEVKFHYVDGMYSYCQDKDGNIIHLVAWAEVDVIEEFT